MKIQKGLVQVLLHDHSNVHGVQGSTSLILGQLLHSHCTRFVSSRDQLSGEVAHILQSHSAMVEMDAQRAVRVGGLQMQVDHVFHAGLHLGGIILINLGVLD